VSPGGGFPFLPLLPAGCLYCPSIRWGWKLEMVTYIISMQLLLLLRQIIEGSPPLEAENTNWKWGVTRACKNKSARNLVGSQGGVQGQCHYAAIRPKTEETYEKWLPAIVSLLLAKRAPLAFWLWCWQIATTWMHQQHELHKRNFLRRGRGADIYQNLSMAEFVICSCHLLRQMQSMRLIAFC